MSTIDRVLGEFIDAWKTGERPDVDAYLARVADDKRDELADRLATWLEVAPTPDYDETTRAQIAQEPTLRSALETARMMRSPLPERVASLRARAGLGVGEVARRLVQAFELDDERRVTDYVERLENGDLDPSRLSHRLISALATILGVDRDQVSPIPPAFAGQALFRADQKAAPLIEQDIDSLSRAALAPAPPPMDDLDRLFLGGPEG